MPTSGGAPGNAASDRLSAFVRDYLHQHDESERGLAGRAIDPETGLTLQHGWINQLAKGRVPRAPELWRLRALAVAMAVPVSMLAEMAAGQWLGVEVAEIKTGEEDWVAVTVPKGMTSAERERFKRAVEDLARHFKED
jgi:anti-sigma factor RsiW